jgi:hypothetical protein
MKYILSKDNKDQSFSKDRVKAELANRTIMSINSNK